MVATASGASVRLGGTGRTHPAGAKIGAAWAAVACTLAALGAAAPAAGKTPSVEELGRLSIEELGNVAVTSVFKRPEPLSRTPAAVYVITSEDIRRSGALSLPEVLRLAPNLHVARAASNTYAISARGFNTLEAANKLLVLIDGRSIYSPLHGGVFWDQQQLLLEDIERIEVVSGPGGALYGANAVNGVINVITKSARQTVGGLVSLAAGTDGSAAARYGGRIGDIGAWRAYALGFMRGESLTSGGSGVGDEWGGRQAGFRTDFAIGENAFTIQGDIFENDHDDDARNSGGNLLVRWSRDFGDAGNAEIQAYYDEADRIIPGLVSDELQSFDVAAQHAFALGTWNEIVWGGGYRTTRDTFRNRVSLLAVDPASETVEIGNLFVQDTVALAENLTLTLGTKLEYSSYSGFDVLPSGRVAWQVTDTDLLWSAVSRAVRTPSRVDRDLVAPGLFERVGSGMKSEEVVAYELGYRGRPSPDASVSVSLYYNDYDHLRVLTANDRGVLAFDNDLEGYTYGLEAWGDWQVNRWWRLSGGVNLIEKHLRLRGSAIPTGLDQHVGNDPEYQLSLRSFVNLSDSVELDIGLRAVDDLPDPAVPDYVAVDARLGWHVTDGLEAWVAAFNLFDEHHAETGAATLRREARRSIYAGARWKF